MLQVEPDVRQVVRQRKRHRGFSLLAVWRQRRPVAVPLAERPLNVSEALAPLLLRRTVGEVGVRRFTSGSCAAADSSAASEAASSATNVSRSKDAARSISEQYRSASRRISTQRDSARVLRPPTRRRRSRPAGATARVRMGACSTHRSTGDRSRSCVTPRTRHATTARPVLEVVISPASCCAAKRGRAG
jgi:hypothetical protein